MAAVQRTAAKIVAFISGFSRCTLGSLNTLFCSVPASCFALRYWPDALSAALLIPAKIAGRQPGGVFFQHLDDLLFREPAFTHRLSPRWRTEPYQNLGVSGEQVGTLCFTDVFCAPPMFTMNHAVFK
jgi:hypothetical protein